MDTADRKRLKLELRRIIERYGAVELAQMLGELRSEMARRQGAVNEVPASIPGEDTRCSFCGRGPADIEGLIAGAGVFICYRCIDLCRKGKLQQQSDKK